MTRFNDIQVQPGQLPGNGHFLSSCEPGSGRQLAISHRGVEYDCFVGRCTPLDLFEFTL